MRRSRTWLWRLGAVAVSLAAVLAVCEVLVRIFWGGAQGGYPPGLFIADDAVGFRLAPNFRARHATAEYDIEIRTSSRGYRSPETADKPPGAQRILALGDSFAFGHGVPEEEAYPAALQRVLRERGRDVEVVNAGVPGYGTANACALLAADADALQVDAVVLGFYLGNDFRDNDTLRSGRLTARSGMLVTLTERDSDLAVTLKVAILTHWRTAQLLFLGLGGAVQTEAEKVRDLCAALAWDPGFGTAMVRRTWDADAERAFATSTQWLERIAELCIAARRGLLVVLLPAPHQYHDALWNIVVDKCRLDAAEFDRDKPSRALVEWGGARGVDVLDLLPEFRARSTGASAARLYIDVHFNAAGHRLAAERIAERIEPHLRR